MMNQTKILSFFIALGVIILSACNGPARRTEAGPKTRIPVIIDTDANNELDDQHAMAYLFFNQDVFDVLGVTVNTTSSGGHIDDQYAEAERVMKLCAVDKTVPAFKGADKSLSEIRPELGDPQFDGHDAVNFIIETGKSFSADHKLVIIAIGKLTNIALAVGRDSSLLHKVRLVWLGSNYPEPGEHNQNNDTVAMNYLLNAPLPFEMVTVRYGKPSGTDAVKITQQEVNEKMGGLGPRIAEPVEGRHGGMFNNFGDYSINLFEHINYDSNPRSRALFDMAAVAIVKNPQWAEHRVIPAPILIDNVWVDRPHNSRSITLWENFDSASIINDLFVSLGYDDKQ